MAGKHDIANHSDVAAAILEYQTNSPLKIMNRRKFGVLAAATCLSSTLLGDALASASIPREGVDYHPLKKPTTPQNNSEKIEILEFFYFGCQACERMDPVLRNWEDRHHTRVSLTRIPVAFSERLSSHVAFYSVLDQLKLANIATPKVFTEVLHNRNYLLTRKSQAEFLETLGVSNATFEKIVCSQTTKSSVARSASLVKEVQLRAVPTIIFNGQYMVNVGTSPARTVVVLDYLLNRARRS